MVARQTHNPTTLSRFASLRASSKSISKGPCFIPQIPVLCRPVPKCLPTASPLLARASLRWYLRPTHALGAVPAWHTTHDAPKMRGRRASRAFKCAPLKSPQPGTQPRDHPSCDAHIVSLVLRSVVILIIRIDYASSSYSSYDYYHPPSSSYHYYSTQFPSGFNRVTRTQSLTQMISTDARQGSSPLRRATTATELA